MNNPRTFLTLYKSWGCLYYSTGDRINVYHIKQNGGGGVGVVMVKYGVHVDIELILQHAMITHFMIYVHRSNRIQRTSCIVVMAYSGQGQVMCTSGSGELVRFNARMTNTMLIIHLRSRFKN